MFLSGTDAVRIAKACCIFIRAWQKYCLFFFLEMSSFFFFFRPHTFRTFQMKITAMQFYNKKTYGTPKWALGAGVKYLCLVILRHSGMVVISVLFLIDVVSLNIEPFHSYKEEEKWSISMNIYPFLNRNFIHNVISKQILEHFLLLWGTKRHLKSSPTPFLTAPRVCIYQGGKMFQGWTMCGYFALITDTSGVPRTAVRLSPVLAASSRARKRVRWFFCLSCG